MKKILKEKVAIVTGSGQGVGREIALCLASYGAKVITNNRKPGSSINAFENTSLDFNEKEIEKLHGISGDAQTTADEIIAKGGEAVPFFGDISDFALAKKMIDFAIQKYGRIDIIVNNASSNWVGNILDMDEKLWDISINSKLKGTFNLMHHAMPIMIKQGYGRFLNSSSDAFTGLEGYAAYGAANAAVNTLTKAVSNDVEGKGITFNAYTPLAQSRSWLNAAAKYRLQGIPEEVIEDMAPPSMQKTAKNMVPFLAYLASEYASDITGKLFKVAADGEIGIWSDSEVVKSIYKEDGAWEIDELKQRIPNELLSNAKVVDNELPMK